MSYSPNNLSIFTAAFSGALAGMGVSDRVPTNSGTIYAGLAQVAGAYAQEFDTTWASPLATEMNIAAVAQMSESAWQQRAPQADATQTLPATFSQLCAALKAIITAGTTQLTAMGITSPQVVANTVVSAENDWIPTNGAGQKTYGFKTGPFLTDGSDDPIILDTFPIPNASELTIYADISCIQVDLSDAAEYQLKMVVLRDGGTITTIKAATVVDSNPNLVGDPWTAVFAVDGTDMTIIFTPAEGKLISVRCTRIAYVGLV